ncbi:PD-(D/E)XK nuclease family protein [bacterium]|nr:PD-(D/E)XK nuclease family protein [bacterium]
MFIDKVAEYINRILENENEIAIVFPSSRAGLYLKKRLYELTKKDALILPDIFSFGSFIGKYSHLKNIDNLSCALKLYQIYKNRYNDNVLDLTLAKQIISDFSEIDKFIIEDDKIRAFFRNLTELSKFDKDLTENTEFLKKYVEMQEKLQPLYSQLNKELRKEGAGYSGMVYKDALKNIKDGYLHYDKVIFAGFNALTPIETRIFEEIKMQGNGDFIWDDDPLFREDKELSGVFLEKNIKKFHNSIDLVSQLEKKKNVRSIMVNRNIDQVQYVSQILNKEKLDAEETLIVLMDESLLVPLLYAIPEHYKKFNVTMGFPISTTPIYESIMLLINAHFRNIIDKRESFYGNDILNILNSANLKSIIAFENDKFDEKNIDDLRNNILKRNELNVTLPKEYGKIFQIINKPVKFLEALNEFLIKMFEFFSKKESINAEYVNTMLNNLKFLSDYINIINQMKMKEFLNLLTDTLRNGSVSFIGEPLEGLQIMGLLETRALDFKNIFILSVNEGIIPRNSVSMSTIPYDIRSYFNMYTAKEDSAIYAYHFFRLLKGAQNIHLVYYNESEDATSASERSRFLSYLLWNNKKGESIGKNWEIQELYYKYDENLLNVPNQPRSVPKNEEIIKQLKERTYSFTAIQTYLTCPYKFYLKYILGLKDDEDDEVVEVMDRGILGSILHYVFQKLYDDKPEKIYELIRNKKAFENRYEDIVNEWNEKEKEGGLKLDYGVNRLYIDVGKDLVDSMIYTEKKERPEVRESEIKTERKYWKKEFLKTIHIKGQGYIDRLEIYDDKIVIIDYKSGKDENFNNIIEKFPLASLDDLKILFEKKHYFAQLLYYTLLIKYNDSGLFKDKEVNVGIYLVSKNLISPLIPISQEYLDSFEKFLSELFGEILNMEVPFTALNNIEIQGKCQYCDYPNYCRK